jgi:Methyl-accepting chemotaxis protein (MCP) signalling domain
MKNLSIAAKIWLSIGVFVAGFVFSTTLEQLQGRSTERDLEIASGDLFPAAQKSQEADAAFQRAVKSFSDAVVTQDTGAADHGIEDGQAAATLINEIAAIGNLPPERAADSRKLGSTIESFVSDAGTAYKTVAGNSSAMTPEMMSRIRDLAAQTDNIKGSLQKTKDSFSRSLQDKLREAQAGSEHQRWIGLGLFVGSLLLASVIVTLTIRRSITGPILRVIEGVRGSADDAAEASGQMAESGRVVAQDAHEQAACLQETMAALREISSTTQKNSDRAVNADGMMTQARITVQSATDAMNKLTESINAISSSNREVAGVLKSLDEIAFNTNILALNAAVEAARAGQAGAGFSVVADEVRSLARRATEAARHSAEIIDKTIGDVANGVQYVAVAHDVFGEVSRRIEQGGQVVSEIATSSETQARGIHNIGQAISKLEKVTQNNAANAQQTAQSASAMTHQVEITRRHLEELVAVVNG